MHVQRLQNYCKVERCSRFNAWHEIGVGAGGFGAEEAVVEIKTNDKLEKDGNNKN